MKGNKYYTPEEIHYMDAGIWTLGNDNLRSLLASALSKIPIKIVNNLERYCIFFMEIEAVKASYYPKGFFNNKCLISISESFFNNAKEEEIIYSILHEVAHYYLKHKHPLKEFINQDYYEKQEKEAYEQVDKWLKEYEEIMGGGRSKQDI